MSTTQQSIHPAMNNFFLLFAELTGILRMEKGNDVELNVFADDGSTSVPTYQLHRIHFGPLIQLDTFCMVSDVHFCPPQRSLLEPFARN